ncbi:hypothetical protein pRL70061 (plasmid) [Rhizobium johnstonii 3841]|uniref:Uncharacterized protein n=1 Tax=Rhizobium johnstonii (strain DSM 114642 / LMG 32736 / 3841) TaxID=216596 RepID=Q1M9V8_RHIJ3|nr:hypothetical protein pRL70061 [Rhizobium johnstonii 3841]
MDLDGNALLEASNNGDMQTKSLGAGFSDFQSINRQGLCRMAMLLIDIRAISI